MFWLVGKLKGLKIDFVESTLTVRDEPAVCTLVGESVVTNVVLVDEAVEGTSLCCTCIHKTYSHTTQFNFNHIKIVQVAT